MYLKTDERIVNSPQHKKPSRLLPDISLYYCSLYFPTPMHSPCGDETYVINKRFIHMLFPSNFKAIRMTSDGGDHK